MTSIEGMEEEAEVGEEELGEEEEEDGSREVLDGVDQEGILGHHLEVEGALVAVAGEEKEAGMVMMGVMDLMEERRDLKDGKARKIKEDGR